MNKIAINSELAPDPIGPYNQAIMVNDTLYVSGQVPIDKSSGNIVSENIEEETHQVMKNLGYILEEAGLSFNHVVKCSIFVKDMDHFATINEVYGSYFKDGNFPARETVEVSRLPKDVNVEISCIAIK